MSKRFSIVEVEENEIFLVGWVLPDQLSNSSMFVEVLSEISSFNSVDIVIKHCLLNDYPGVVSDITSDELEAVVDVFFFFFDDDYIYLEEEITFEMNGLLEEEIIESKIE